MVAHESKPIMHFATPANWEAWLQAEGSDLPGVRLKLRKKGSTMPGIVYAEALDVALCHGWIDGQSNAFDTDFYLVSFTHRRAKSMWSQVNRDHVARLVAEGRMRPAGLAEVERARADGRWDAAYRQKDAEVPEDLRSALAANPAAAAAFAALSAQNRFAILFRIGAVKRAATRAAKIENFVSMLARGETP
ncbi:bacteriocin-protection protein, YdeI/OmpD-associated family [Glaciihabitans sp. INWT7]|uniref:YdeI/OmpD-associated family protein n=1 Tax=Glaciihabitans sp. INWT7 TaxID=2596912 RepID=UPI001629EA5C|nr:YdeI/OmpD-associated family protein [Glaciihabitans sp. INWT7]QNE47278.1 bacteriocin-protection protein, YdeI/OmpD-associated family [Glaciihabitans sp. INWT7]